MTLNTDRISGVIRSVNTKPQTVVKHCSSITELNNTKYEKVLKGSFLFPLNLQVSDRMLHSLRDIKTNT